jgi:hypothetical protein
MMEMAKQTKLKDLFEFGNMSLVWAVMAAA